MDIAAIRQAMSGQSVTKGWDAICALNAKQASAILFQQYLQRGPTSPDAIKLRAVLAPDTQDFNFLGDLNLLDLHLGPPDVSFAADLTSQQIQIDMILVKGALVTFSAGDGGPVFKSAVVVRPNESWLTGAVNLAQVRGADDLGEIQVHLASGAYRPRIAGLDPESMLVTQIGDAAQAFFAHTATTYGLGTILEGDIPPPLQPTDFRFLTQPAPDGVDGDGCIVIFIRTNGQDGVVEPLTPYPIPSGATAAVIVSNQVVFNQLMPAGLTREFQRQGTAFAGERSGDLWRTRASGGALDVGVLGANSGIQPYSSDAAMNVADVMVPTDGLTVAPSGGNLALTLNQRWDQYWTYFTYIVNPSDGSGRYDPAAGATGLVATCSSTWTPIVDPTTDIVRFNGDGGTASLTPSDPPHWYTDLVEGQYEVEGEFQQAIQDDIKGIFAGLVIPEVNTFALGNILFPSRQDALRLTQASLPGDLLLTGRVASAWQLSPVNVSLRPGGRQQFTVTLAGTPTTDVLWESSSSDAGSIDQQGLFTACARIDGPQIAVVTAIDKQDQGIAARALVLVYEAPPTASLVISPAGLIVTQGNPFDLRVTDDKGRPVDADCTIAPDAGFLARKDGVGAVWTYFPPESIQAPSLVTVTAVSNVDATKTGTSTIQLATPDTVTIAPASSNVSAGQTLSLQVSAPTLDEFTWVVYPTGAGSIAADDDDSSAATYTASASVASRTRVMIAAYGIEDGVVGIGLAQIDLSPT